MAELRKLENNYSKDYREAFEDLATLMFCTYLGLPHGVNRRINQKGIESDPVTIDGKVYAYQAKYYDASTRLYEKKADFINSIEAARKKGVTNLLFFVNKNLPDTDNKSDEEPQYIKDINKAAKGNGKKTEVVLDWWTLSKIETTLDRDEYCYIQRIYLGGISGETGCLPFYDYIYNQFYGDSENQLYGNVPLRDFYIETTVNVKDENDKNQSVRKFIETWLENDGSIAVISGEPGHGKTSLCKKAMCDFYKDGWLAGKVSNVFCFSLNPANTDALANDGFYLYSLLSWGEDRKSSEQVIKKKDCENALVFFDGFDELLEWHPRFDLKTFIREYIVRFQKYSKAHIIITSRNMAVESNKEAYEIEKGVCVPIIRLQLLTRVQQIEWIEKCIDYNKEAMSNELESHRIKGELKRSEHELEEYLKHYKQFSANDKLQTLLGIPIIFRMIVAARYLPKNNQSITQLYDSLFHATWSRHIHNWKAVSVDPEMETKTQLSKHALKVFADNNDSAVVDDLLKSFWLFSFYTTHGGKKRVGFLHRSFYQYFLANEVLSWYRQFADDNDKVGLSANLSNLAYRRLDKTTLSFIKDFYGKEDKEYLNDSFNTAFEIIKETDGIIELYSEEDANKDRMALKLDGANNIFWNVISIGSLCGKEISSNEVNVRALRLYDLEGCVLSNAKLEKTSLSGATFIGTEIKEVDFRDADLSRADFSDAKLHGVNFSRANLLNADFSGADLNGTNLREAFLSGAHFEGAFINATNLSKAYLVGADFSNARSYDADFSCTNLYKADFSNAALNYANLSRTSLQKADFSNADLSNANLGEANLRSADFSYAMLNEANLSNAILIRADLSGANLCDADLSGANLYGANINEISFNNTVLSETKIDKKNADYLLYRGCDTSEMIIIDD